jgi:hypothetical protein
MDMSVSSVYVTPSVFAQLLAIFCVLWPLMAWSLIPHRGRSSAPLAAMLVPMALSVGVMCVGFARVLEGMARYGSGSGAAEAAGIAEALFTLLLGAYSAGGVAVVALIRRHRPTADTPIVMLYALTIAEVASALWFRPRVAVIESQLIFCNAAAIMAGVIAIAAFVRAWLTARGRSLAPTRRYGVALVLVATVATGFAVWQQAERFMSMAIHGH